MENFYEQLHDLPGNLANHLMISVIPLSIGVAISLPLAVFVVQYPRIRYPVLTGVSIIQTIPSLALLALMVPLLAGLSSVTARLFGLEISALGFYPTVIALTLYSMLPMVRNSVTGLTGVDAAVLEAARGMGMTKRQVFWKIELPLAAPVIIAGIRTATVWVVGIATLATPVGQRSLGNFIFRGLQTRNWTAVLFGCVAAAVLAMLLDLLIGGIERAVKERNRRLGTLSIIALLILLLGGLSAPTAVRRIAAASATAAQTGEVSVRTVRIGSKTFTEQYILAELIRGFLSDAGFSANVKESLGSTVIFDALSKGEIDIYVDYTGTIWANYMGRDRPESSQRVLEEVTTWLDREHRIRCLGALGFENAYGLAMTRTNADALRIRSIGDLAAHAPLMKIGGDYEFFGRPEWRAIRDAYALRFADRISFDSTFMYDAVVKGKVDVISAFTSDGRIAAMDLKVLDDPKNAIPPYDAVLLLSRSAAADQAIVEALEPLIGAIGVDMIRRANYKVDRDSNKRTVAQAAGWLHECLTHACP